MFADTIVSRYEGCVMTEANVVSGQDTLNTLFASVLLVYVDNFVSRYEGHLVHPI